MITHDWRVQVHLYPASSRRGQIFIVPVQESGVIIAYHLPPFLAAWQVIRPWLDLTCASKLLIQLLIVLI